MICRTTTSRRATPSAPPAGQAHVAYALPPLTREERAAHAQHLIDTEFTDKQRAFLDFVLLHYVTVGVEELDQEKLAPLLKLRYHDSIADAIADLGKAAEIRKISVPEIRIPGAGGSVSAVSGSLRWV